MPTTPLQSPIPWIRDPIKLIIGDKNFSSWSMRPWLALKHLNLPFLEVNVHLDRPETADWIAKHSPSGRVPALEHGPIRVWESLAILEYIAEAFPTHGLWPSDLAARTWARAISHEMHSGFSSLRSVLSMDMTADLPGRGIYAARDDIRRIEAIWSDCRAHFREEGDFLFGEFSIADAMYAPVVSRFRTYHVESASSEIAEYRQSIEGLSAYREWLEGARLEIWERRPKP